MRLEFLGCAVVFGVIFGITSKLGLDKRMPYLQTAIWCLYAISTVVLVIYIRRKYDDFYARVKKTKDGKKIPWYSSCYWGIHKYEVRGPILDTYYYTCKKCGNTACDDLSPGL